MNMMQWMENYPVGLQLMSLMDACLPQSSNERVELSVLRFLDQSGFSTPQRWHPHLLGIVCSSGLWSMELGAAWDGVLVPVAIHTVGQSISARMLIGLARDLRGIAFALNTKTSYTMLLDWIFPEYISVLQRAIELWYQEPACTTSILELMTEFLLNR
ncbi:ran-binding protein 17 [Excalfactoria chinensis]|uniref:ran-binding protein 17 n=1 Tax=Excalfactoria chinensis TaxID=46218 RepID=UPI003B3B4A0A